MSIIDWGSQTDKVEISSGTESDQELLIGILKLNVTVTTWKGRVVYKGARNVFLKPARLSVELKGTIRGSAVKIVIGHHPDMDSQWTPVQKDRTICISANGKMHFLPDELQEMNLAILEGHNVLDNYRANGWADKS